jgi:hypothetical protein
VGLKKRLKGCLTLPTFVGMARYKNTTGMLYHLTTLGRDLRMSEVLDFEYRVEKSRMPSKKTDRFLRHAMDKVEWFNLLIK